MIIIWCMVSEISSATNKIFCHFGPFFALLQIKKSKFWKNEKTPADIIILHLCKYDVWSRRYEAWWTEFFVILNHFLPFYPHKNSNNQNFEKNFKNAWRYHHSKNHDHMPHYSWDMMRDWCNYFLFWAIFCPFTSLATQKIKI